MRYFAYVNECDPELAVEIYEEVFGLERYAMSVYKKSDVSDILDKAYYHILTHYNKDAGDLHNYAIKIVKTIDKRKTRENVSSENTVVESDKVVARTYAEGSKQPVKEISEAVEKECLSELIPYFLTDYKLMIQQKREARKLNYKHIFQTYHTKVVLRCVRYLCDTYADDMLRMDNVRKECIYKSFSSDRYKASLDKIVEYRGTVNGTLLYSISGKSVSRYFYRLNIKKLVNRVIDTIYSDEHYSMEFEGDRVYCSLSGVLVIGLDSLREIIENELVGAILARNSRINVVVYERGSSMILSFANEILQNYDLNIFGRNFLVEFKILNSKKLPCFPKRQ